MKTSNSNKEKKQNSLFFDYVIEKIRITIIVVVHILYPEILRKSFSLMNCREIDNATGLSTLALSPNVECWTSQHNSWVLKVALPGIICWGVFVPLLFLITLVRNRKLINESTLPVNDNFNINIQTKMDKYLEVEGLDLASEKKKEEHEQSRNEEGNLNKDMERKKGEVDDQENEFDELKKNQTSKRLSSNSGRKKLDGEFFPKLVINFGYYYRGYRKETYFWEIVLFSRKFLLIFVGILTSFFPRYAKSTIFLIIINLYLFFQIQFKPYKNSSLNKLETSSLIVCFLTSIFGILLYSENLKNISTTFASLVALLNLGYILYWLYLFWRDVFGKQKANLLCKDLRVCNKRKKIKLNID